MSTIHTKQISLLEFSQYSGCLECIYVQNRSTIITNDLVLGGSCDFVSHGDFWIWLEDPPPPGVPRTNIYVVDMFLGPH